MQINDRVRVRADCPSCTSGRVGTVTRVESSTVSTRISVRLDEPMHPGGDPVWVYREFELEAA